MPRVIADRDATIAALKSLEITAELFTEVDGKLRNAGDLEVIVDGRENSSGKRVGPYVRLLAYDSEETIMRQGDWGGNTFYLSVSGVLDVYISIPNDEKLKISRLQPGSCFGEMAVLAGVERNATVVVPKHGKATVLEINRPALRLLRKLPRFGVVLNETYRTHGFGRVLQDLTPMMGPAGEQLVRKLREISKFKVYGKHHVIATENTPIRSITLIRSGWVRRVRGVPFDPTSTGVAVGMGQSIGVDFLGPGNCLGLEGADGNAKWSYSVACVARTEVVETPVAPLRHDSSLRSQIVAAFAGFSAADDRFPIAVELEDLATLAAAEEEITTGIVDGANLLVMDMDLCVRCGNCSLACHKVHGQSRLLRRGIHIERPIEIGLARTQHILSPQVCMHCKDPECLTGCPTGAIFRDPKGFVDIDPAICIGCFDCATQCPYDAISMVPRASDGRAHTFNLIGNLKRALRSKTPPQGEQLTPADDLVAIKCNLCEHTPLNPPNAKRPAYSCEENCPTGALLRVNPVQYFSEVNATQGIIFQQQNQAFGRNIHKSDPPARLMHFAGLFLVLLTILAIISGLARNGLDDVLAGSWLTMRWLTGLAGLAGVAAVMTYPLRKQVYRRRAGALRYWLLVHTYIGAFAGVVLMFHAGIRTGGLLTTALYISFDFCIASGLFGIAVYLIAPRILTSIEGDPLLIEDLIGRREELRKELEDIENRSEQWLRDEIKSKAVNKFRSVRFLLRQFTHREPLTVLLAKAREPLKQWGKSLPTDVERIRMLTATETAVTLRRVDALILLHRLLKIWVAPHVISTSIMLALMIVHIIQVVYFSSK